jgi:hypothetical protein
MNAADRIPNEMINQHISPDSAHNYFKLAKPFRKLKIGVS